MSVSFDVISARLDGVRTYRAAAGILRAARAFCPAHQQPPHRHGRGRTLSVAETADGQVLLHCHAGCASADVLAAVGLALADLYPGSHAGDRHAREDRRGIAAWASAASAADSLAKAAGRLLLDQSAAAVVAMWDRCEEFRALARAAMRGEEVK